MIRRPTVLVLGAGASQPYGFPSGAGLATEVARNLASLRGRFVRDIAEALHGNLDETMVRDFVRDFAASGRTSLDAFVESRPEFIDLVKHAMAAVLIPFEKPEDLLNRSENVD